MIREYKDKNELMSEIKFVLGFYRGAEKRINRWKLVQRIYGEEAVTEDTKNDENPYDRRVRDAIEELRYPGGMHICNLGDGKGYFIANTRAEWEAGRAYYLGPQTKKYITVSHLDKMADEQWGKVEKPAPEGQMGLFEAVAR